MNELKVVQTLGTIECNFEETRIKVQSIADGYIDAVFHEDTVADAKKHVATLRKFKKALNDKKIEVGKAYSLPLAEFESKVKELQALIDKPIEEIGLQIEVFETARKEKKKKAIEEIYNSLLDEIKEVVTLGSIYLDKWENKGCLLDDIKKDIEEVADKVLAEITLIKSMKSDVEKKALDIYKINRNLASAIEYINDDINRKREIIEQEKERTRQAEAEQIRKEERLKIQQEQQIEKEVADAKEETTNDLIESLTPVFETEEEMEELVYKIRLNKDGKNKLEMFMDSVGIDYQEECEAWL